MALPSNHPQCIITRCIALRCFFHVSFCTIKSLNQSLISTRDIQYHEPSSRSHLATGARLPTRSTITRGTARSLRRIEVRGHTETLGDGDEFVARCSELGDGVGEDFGAVHDFRGWLVTILGRAKFAGAYLEDSGHRQVRKRGRENSASNGYHGRRREIRKTHGSYRAAATKRSSGAGTRACRTPLFGSPQASLASLRS